jgi:hypothetical protein
MSVMNETQKSHKMPKSHKMKIVQPRKVASVNPPCLC